MWFREYIFNVIIQPFHLILYAVLVGSAMDLVTTNMIYGVVAIGFLVPAEKLLRKFFGFDNAGTLSAAGSFAGGAVFSAMINKMNRPKPPQGGRGGNDGDGKDGTRPIRKSNSGGGGVNPEGTLTGIGPGPTRPTPPPGGPGGTPPPPPPPGGPGGSPPPPPPPGGPGGSPTPPPTPGGPGGSPTPPPPPGGPGGSPTPPPPPGSPGGSPTPPGGSSSTLPSWAQENGMSRWNRLTGGAFKGATTGALKGHWKDAFKEAGKGMKGSLGDSARAVGYRYQRKVVNGVKSLPKTGGRWIRKGAVKGVSALAGGSLALAGAAVGAASGDPSKALQYALAGGAAGFSGANYYGSKIGDGLAKEAGEVTKTASAAFWGKQAKERQQYLFDKEFKSNPANIDTLTKALGSRDEAKAAMNDGRVQALLNNGITDPNKVAKALSLEKKLEKGMPDKNKHPTRAVMTRNEALEAAVATAKWNRDISTRVYDPMSRERAEFENKLTKKLTAQGMTDVQAKSRVQEILDDMESFET